MDYLIKITGDKSLHKASMPWDWMIAPIEGAIRMIEAREFYPTSINELEIREQTYWKTMGVYYWHEYRKPGQSPAVWSDVVANYAEVGNKYAHKAENLCLAGRAEHIVGIVCNTQNNLEYYRTHPELGISIDIKTSDVQRLKMALTKYYGKEVHMLLATRKDRYTQDGSEEGIWVKYLEPDSTDYEGDPVQWKELLGQMVKKHKKRSFFGFAI